MILSNLSRRMILSGLAILLLILLAFSLSVYAFVQERSYDQLKGELSIVVDSAISSIDFDQTERHDAGEPDILSSVIPEESATSLKPLKLQWYSASGALGAEKGNLVVNTPFNSGAAYQFQNTPHAILMTKAARAHGRLLGYVRVAEPLAPLDNQMKDLAVGLFLGTLVALAVSAGGGWWLLRLSLRPTEVMISQLEQFVADASHELRSPLMVIQTNCDAALRTTENKTDKLGTKLVAIKSATDQMIALTRDLLSLTKVERRVSTTQTVNLLDLLTPYLNSIGAQPEYAGITLKTSIPENLTLSGSPEDMQRLYCNIVENAFRYSSGPGQVTISGEKVGKLILLVVEDTGIGIAAQDLPKIFDRFWRADKARNYRDNGNGLGLAIASSVARAYGGTIYVSSEPGKGSKFTISMPAAIGAPATNHLAASNH